MKSFFRHIFYFSKSQKLGLLVLLVLLIVVIAFNLLVKSHFGSSDNSYKDSLFMAAVDSFKKNLKPLNERHEKNSYTYGDNIKHQNTPKPLLFVFDPNTLDSSGFVALGLKPFIAKNIINYRRKGGFFNKPEDFARIYGLRNSDFVRLRPYINIIVYKKKEVGTSIKEAESTAEDISAKEFPADTMVIELNTADTTQLKQLRGVGSYYAQQIIYYRNRLGGYYSVQQLLEIENFPLNTFDNIKHQLRIDTTKIKKIRANWASVERLKAHPYLDFYQSRAIFELRKSTGRLKKEDLFQLKEFSAPSLEKIMHYFSF